MHLSVLLKDLISIPPEADQEVSRLTLDSRSIQPKDLFIAVKGSQIDGRQFIPAAIARGAVAILAESEDISTSLNYQQQVPIISLPDLQQKLGRLAAIFYQHPSQHLYVFGVTGTNGKTSCTHFIAQILQALKQPCGVIGTLGSGLYGALGEAGLTTPDAISLQAMLRSFADQGAKAAAMEVSSHSIHQGRVNAIHFEIGIFTNLTQDHLDYHRTMDAYAAVKYRFLAEFPIKQVVINADDIYGKNWIQTLASERSVLAYSVRKPEHLPDNVSCVYAEDISLTLRGIHAKLNTPWGKGELFLPLIGQFNLSNALAVLTALCAFGIPLQSVLKQLTLLTSVPGRMQMLGGTHQPLVVVDYAHTPDALDKVLQALRAHTQGKLHCVFGCGGDRDHGKRPLMAKIAEQWADQIIVTNDNPRHELPETIAQQILSGFNAPDCITVELDRSKAIEKSIQLASMNDCILIAGKGAERYQQIGDEKIPFEDVSKVTDYLRQYWGRAES